MVDIKPQQTLNEKEPKTENIISCNMLIFKWIVSKSQTQLNVTDRLLKDTMSTEGDIRFTKRRAKKTKKKKKSS